MDTTEIMVTTTGVLLIAFTLWFFFGAREATAATVSAGGVQEVNVVVQGGYSPDRIEVRQGQPVRLNFRREDTSSCTEQVVFGDFGIIRDLPTGQNMPIEFTPDKPGEFTFACGMNMVRGKLIVKQS